MPDLAFYLAHGKEVRARVPKSDDPRLRWAVRLSMPCMCIAFLRANSTRHLPGSSIINFRSIGRWRYLIQVMRQCDIVIAKTGRRVSVVAAGCAAGGARSSGSVFPRNRRAGAIHAWAAGASQWRNRSLRDAEATAVIGDLMARKVQALGTPAERIHVIPNWSNDEDIQPIALIDNPLRQTWGLEGKFVLGYSGNLGRAHEFDTVLAAAERLRNDKRFVFLMIGGGKRFEELARIVKQRGLDSSFRFIPIKSDKCSPIL